MKAVFVREAGSAGIEVLHLEKTAGGLVYLVQEGVSHLVGRTMVAFVTEYDRRITLGWSPGWEVFDTNGGSAIQAVDEDGIFEDDEAALSHVEEMCLYGSTYSANALREVASSQAS